MDVSRRQFLKSLSSSSAAVATTPLAALEGLSTKVAAGIIAKTSSPLLRLNIIEQALVSTYGLIDATGTMRRMGGLITGAEHTAYTLAAHTNFMLGEVPTPEARSVLLRLLRPSGATRVLEEARGLFEELRRQQTAADTTGDLDDFRASYLGKLDYGVQRLSKNSGLSDLISRNNSSGDPLTQRVAGWCENLFAGDLQKVQHDRLFDALSTLHRMEICGDIPFCPHRQRELLRVLREEGLPHPERIVYSCRAEILRDCELVYGAINNELLSSRTFHHPPHLIAATENTLKRLGKIRLHSWQDFYHKAVSDYLTGAKSENSAEIW